jgi:hypothetical protein
MCTRKPPFCRLLQFRDMSIETNHVTYITLVTSAWVPLLVAGRVERCKLCILQVHWFEHFPRATTKESHSSLIDEWPLHSHINQSSSTA